MPIEPYLFFEGRCEEAINFYRTALGAEVEMAMRYKDSPEPCASGTTPPGDKIMHASIKIGDSRILLSDGHAKGAPSFQGFGLSLPVKTESDADRTFNALSSGGKVQLPLTKTFFSPRFGMVSDKFGVLWMVMVPQQS
jgi:PhnB protein